MAFNLFALTTDPNSRIVRFALSADVQNALTDYLKAQEADFLAASGEQIEFDGKYKPDPGEVLVIGNFDDIDGLAQVIANPLGAVELAPSEEVFGSIKALFSGYIDDTGRAVVLIQNFDKRKIISTNGLSIFHSANVFKRIEGIGVTVDSRLSAILTGKQLKFFSFHAVRQVFDLSQHYREATDADIHDFAAMGMIKVDDLGKLIELSDSWVRRKYSLIQQSQILEKVPLNDIKAVALDFDIPMLTVLEEGVERIVLPDNKAQLKVLLRFLDEDYYKSPLSKTQYLTNSKKPA